MRLNLFIALRNEGISLQEFQNALHIHTENLIQKFDGVQDFNKQEIAILHQLFSEYDLQWLLEIDDIQ